MVVFVVKFEFFFAGIYVKFLSLATYLETHSCSKKTNDILFWTAGIYFLFRNFNFMSQKNQFISKYSYSEKLMQSWMLTPMNEMCIWYVFQQILW